MAELLTRFGELRADIARERERRHWTIEQWCNIAGKDWLAAATRCQTEADAAVDELVERLERAEAEREQLRQGLDWALGQIRAADADTPEYARVCGLLDAEALAARQQEAGKA